MASNLKGNLGLKSSALAPTSAKLTTQYLVLDHMNNHFNKIAKAKSAIDTRPPKSLMTSQKMRDRKNRSRLVSSPRTRPISSMTEEEIQEYENVLNNEEPEDEEERLVHSIMKSTLVDKQRGSNQATQGSHTDYPEGGTYMSQGTEERFTSPYQPRHSAARPMSARSTRSYHSVTSTLRTSVPVKTHDPMRITYDGDILDKRSHKFTEPGRAFTPRTNISHHQSRLRASKNYQPPKPKTKKVNNEGDYSSYTKERPRTASDHSNGRRGPSRPEYDLGQTGDTAQLSESMLMDITLQSRDERQGAQDGVPRLDISMDNDHLHWLKEQADKAQVRARSGAHVPRSHIVRDIHPISEEDSARSRASLKEKTLEKPLTPRRAGSHWFVLKLKEEEEEQKYIAFAKEVTDDVLSRGISTDRVMSRVFESHIERRKKDLDETRMRSVVQGLKKDLGLRDSSQERNLDRSLADFNYSNHGSGRPGSAASRDSSLRADSKSSFSGTNGLSGTKSLLATNGFDTALGTNYGSRNNLGNTMESTSTMKFGRTTDMFSTINSEAAKEEEEDDLNSTHDAVLQQYQLSLKVNESESATQSQSGPSTDLSDKSMVKLDRPATGELRESDSSTMPASSTDGSHRNRRRDRMKRSQESVQNGQGSESATNGLGSTMTDGVNHETASIAESTMSFSSEKSQRPTAKPRSSRSQVSTTLESSAVISSNGGNESLKGGETVEDGSLGNTGNTLASGRSVETKEEEGDDEYEDDYEDEGQGSVGEGGSTQRLSDDDF